MGGFVTAAAALSMLPVTAVAAVVSLLAAAVAAAPAATLIAVPATVGATVLATSALRSSRRNAAAPTGRRAERIAAIHLFPSARASAELGGQNPDNHMFGGQNTSYRRHFVTPPPVPQLGRISRAVTCRGVYLGGVRPPRSEVIHVPVGGCRDLSVATVRGCMSVTEMSVSHVTVILWSM